MPRVYTVVFKKVSVSAVQDLIAIYGTVGKTTKIKEITVADVDAPSPSTNTQLALELKTLTEPVVAGSGGSAATPQKTDPGDAAASFTARVNDTTQATGAATSDIREDGSNIYPGYTYPFDPPIIIPCNSSGAGAAVLALVTALGTAVTLSGTMVVEEEG